MLNVDGYDEGVAVPSFGPRMVCTACGIIGAHVRPNWSAVVCDPMGVANSSSCTAGEHDGRAFLYAFDLLELDGVDLRPFALERRKDRLRILLLGCARGIQFSEHLEDDGAAVFAHACRLGCEGIVSKDRTRPLPFWAEQDLDQDQKPEGARRAAV